MELFWNLISLLYSEENDFGSGAGSGNNNYDDEDGDTEGGDDRDESGSGMGEYDPMFGRSGAGSTTTSHQESSPAPSSDLGHSVEVDVSSTVRSVDIEVEQTVNVLGGNSSIGGSGDERVVVPQEPKSGTGPTKSGTETSSGSAGGQPPMSVARAVVTYFFPIFVAWFGGIFSVLL